MIQKSKYRKIVVLFIALLFIVSGFFIWKKFSFKTPQQLLNDRKDWKTYSDSKITLQTPWELKNDNGIIHSIGSTDFVFDMTENDIDDKRITCPFGKCDLVYTQNLCVDDLGMENTQNNGCVELLKEGSLYTYYRFSLYCKPSSHGIDSQGCSELFDTIISTLKFNGVSDSNLKTYDNGQFLFQYPSQFVYKESPGRVSVYTNNSDNNLVVSFIVLAKDKNQDFENFVFQVADSENKLVSGLDDFTYPNYILYKNKDDQVSYLIQYPNDSAHVLRINDYLSVYGSVNYSQLVDIMIKSLKFNK